MYMLNVFMDVLLIRPIEIICGNLKVFPVLSVTRSANSGLKGQTKEYKLLFLINIFI